MPTGLKKSIFAPSDDGPSLGVISRWLSVKKEAKRLVEDEKAFNKKVAEQVEEFGEVGENGHIWLYLDQPVEGWDNRGNSHKFNAIKRQRNTTVVLDTVAAAEILTEKGILDECSTSHIQVTDPAAAIKVLKEAGLLDSAGFEVYTDLDPDKIRAQYFAENPKLSKAEYEEIFKEKVTAWLTIPYKV